MGDPQQQQSFTNVTPLSVVQGAQTFTDVSPVQGTSSGGTAKGGPSAEESAFLGSNKGYQWVPADPKFPNRPEGIYPTGPGNEWRSDPSYTQAPVDLLLAKHTYEGAKMGLMAATAPLALEATLPQLAGGAVGATVGSTAATAAAKHFGAGETGQQVAGDVGGVVGGGIGGGAADWAATKAKSLYEAMPPEVQRALIGVISPRLKHALNLADALGVGKGPQPVYPGASLPEQINPALVSPARTLPGQISPEVVASTPQATPAPIPARTGLQLPGSVPSEALGTLPVKTPITETPEAVQAKPLSQLPIHAVNQAVKELGLSAPIPSLTARANQIANLAVEGAGGTIPEPLKPNVPLREQMAAQSSPGAEQVKTNIRSAQGLQAGGKTYLPSGGSASELPEPQPRTAPVPRESSAINAFHYDPATNEMHITWKGGSTPTTYVYGEVTPEQSDMFHAAESKGMAAKSIKDNNVLVAKIVNGKRIPMKPVISPEDEISPEEWQAGHELESAVEGSPRR